MSTKFTQDQLVEGILKHGTDILEHCLVVDNIDKYKDIVEKEHLNYPIPKTEFNKDNWFMPQTYKDMDIKQYILAMCRTDEQVERVNVELAEYEKRGLLMLLKQMKYIIDTLRKNNIVWGVGRGSSVASYILFLMGVHRIDSIKYNIPLNEFFKGVENG